MGSGFYRPLFLFTLLLLTPVGIRAEDRADKNADAAKQARDGNQQQLQPQMLNYLNKAREHFERADQAEQQRDSSTAERERKLAQMEQMKAQKTQEQMKANEKSAQDNTQAENKLRENPDPKGEQKKAKSEENKVITVRLGESMATQAAPSIAPESTVPDAQLARFEDFRASQENLKKRFQGEEAKVIERPPSASPPSETTKNLDRDLRAAEARAATVTFADASPKTDDAVKPTERSLARATSYSAPASVAPGGAAATGVSGEAAFWKSVGDLATEGDGTQADDGSPEKSLGLRGLRGQDAKLKEKLAAATGDKSALPGEKLSDEAFWKKVGTDPRECRGTSGKAKAKCLRVARQGIEKRWRAGQKKSPARLNVAASGEKKR